MNWLLRKLLGRPSPKTSIDLKAFLLDAELLGVELGQTKKLVLSLLPKSENESFGNEEFKILSYGDLEFHFSHDILYSIFADFTGVITGGKSIVFENKWLFNHDSTALHLAYVVEALKIDNINYRVEENKKLQTILIHLNSNIALHFETDGSTAWENYQFSAFGLSDFTVMTST